MDSTSVTKITTCGCDENPDLSNIARKIEIIVRKHHMYLRIVLATIIGFKVRQEVYS